MTDRQAQVTRFLAKVMEDRLALVVAEAMGNEIEAILERDFDSAKGWEASVTMLLSDDDTSRHRQGLIRASPDYEQASAKVREWLRGILRTHGARIGKQEDKQ